MAEERRQQRYEATMQAGQRHWFTFLTVLVDLGYFGSQHDYAGEGLLVPHKKPRKSQHNPTPTLTDAQRADNQSLGRLHVTIEHARAGLKRYNI